MHNYVIHSPRCSDFCCLLRWAQIALQQIWALLMYRRKADKLRPVWELRTHMGFLVDNLQYYVQVSENTCMCVHVASSPGPSQFFNVTPGGYTQKNGRGRAGLVRDVTCATFKGARLGEG